MENVRELLADATRLRMVSDVPLGAFLSGGLDSSITVALMAKQSASPIQTFHIDFDEPEVSEIAYARRVARLYGTDHHERVVKPSATDFLDELVGSLDEPFADSSSLPTYHISRFARERVTVALAGDGGDESFGGYSRYRRILARRKLAPPVRHAVRLIGNFFHACLPRSAPGRRYIKELGLTHLQSFAVGTSEIELRELLTKEFLESTRGACTLDTLNPGSFATDSTDPLAPYTYFDSMRYLPDDILTKVDRMSMANSLEVRSPFLDHRVFELAATFPHDWKIKCNDTKVILKDAFADDLPSDILTPRKRGFSMPVARWLRTELKDAVNEAIHDPGMVATGMFRMAELRALYREQMSRRNRSKIIDSSCSDLLWRYLIFFRWWRRRSEHQLRQNHEQD